MQEGIHSMKQPQERQIGAQNPSGKYFQSQKEAASLHCETLPVGLCGPSAIKLKNMDLIGDAAENGCIGETQETGQHCKRRFKEQLMQAS